VKNRREFFTNVKKHVKQQEFKVEKVSKKWKPFVVCEISFQKAESLESKNSLKTKTSKSMSN